MYKRQKIYSLIVNTRNANAFTGKQGYESLKKIADLTAKQLNKKQEEDEDNPKKISYKNIIFVPFFKKTRITFNDEEVKNANSKETLKLTLDLIKQDQSVS